MTFSEPVHVRTRRRLLPRGLFGLTLTQILASALAAATATVAASYLGVSGTVVGAAIASVVTVVGNAVYGHSLRTTRDRVRDVVLPTAWGRPLPATLDAAPVLPEHRPARVEPAPQRSWRSVALAAVAVFAAVLAVVTGVEAVAGRPLSDLVRGDAGSGTTVFGDGTGGGGGGAGQQVAPPTVTMTVTPSVVITTPTVTQTAPPVTHTVTPTPSVTTTAPASSTPAPPSASRPSSTATAVAP